MDYIYHLILTLRLFNYRLVPDLRLIFTLQSCYSYERLCIKEYSYHCYTWISPLYRIDGFMVLWLAFGVMSERL